MKDTSYIPWGAICISISWSQRLSEILPQVRSRGINTYIFHGYCFLLLYHRCNISPTFPTVEYTSYILPLYIPLKMKHLWYYVRALTASCKDHILILDVNTGTYSAAGDLTKRNITKQLAQGKLHDKTSKAASSSSYYKHFKLRVLRYLT